MGVLFWVFIVLALVSFVNTLRLAGNGKSDAAFAWFVCGFIALIILATSGGMP